MKKIRHIRELKLMQKALEEKATGKQEFIRNNWSGLKDDFKPINIGRNFLLKLFGSGSDKSGSR